MPRPIPVPRSIKKAVWERLDERYPRRESMRTLEDRASLLEGRAGSFEQSMTALTDEVRRGLDTLGQAASDLRSHQIVTQEGISKLEEAVEAVLARLGGIDDLSRQLSKLRDRLEAEEVARSRSLTDTYRQVGSLLSLHSSLLPDSPLPPLGGWALSPVTMSYVVTEILARRPDEVVEFGSGTSTVVMALAMEKIDSGRITSFEHDQQYLALTSRQLEVRGLTNRVKLVHAPLTETETETESESESESDGVRCLWYSVPEGALPDDIEIILVDGPPSTPESSRYPALPRTASLMTAGAILVLDDARREDERLIIERWLAGHDEFDLQMIDEYGKGAAILTRR